MTRDKAIAELVRIWHSPHLDLMLKARLGEVIETLKEKNQSDSLVRDDAENCKESESKLDLISRADAIDAVFDTEPFVMMDGKHLNRSTVFQKTSDVIDALSALPSAEPPVLTCNGCRHVGTYDTDFPCSVCIRREKDYYEQER